MTPGLAYKVYFIVYCSISRRVEGFCGMSDLEKKRRNSSFELLRIVSMIMILGLHYLNAGIGGGLKTEDVLNHYLAVGFESICIISVNCFVLISGYYMIHERRIRIKKMLNLFLMMVFYGLLLFGIALLTGEKEFSAKNLFAAAIPFVVGKKWFLRTYLILMLLSPFLNRLIEVISKKQLFAICMILLVLFSFWPSFLPKPPVTDGGYGIIQFITLYFLAAFARKYYTPMMDRRSRMISCLIVFLSVIAIFMTTFVPKLSHRQWNYNYLFNIIGSMSLFALFLNFKPFTNLLINNVAKLCFGVYLSHATLQKLIYHQIMNISYYRETKWFVLHFFICIVLQFCVFAFIDYARMKIWPYTIGRIMRVKYLDRIEEKVNGYVDSEEISILSETSK